MRGGGVVLGNGHADRWLVGNRTITITSNWGGTLDTMTYHANVDLLQVGNFQGTIDLSETTLNVVDKTQAVEPYMWPALYPLLILRFEGKWAAVDGAQGNGTFFGQMVFVPWEDDEGNVHIDSVVPYLPLDGTPPDVEVISYVQLDGIMK